MLEILTIVAVLHGVHNAGHIARASVAALAPVATAIVDLARDAEGQTWVQ